MRHASRTRGGAHRIPERFVGRQACFVDRFQVKGHEPLTLFVGDLPVPVHIDDVLEAELLGETIRAADDSAVNQVRWSTWVALAEELRLEHRVREDLVVEDLLGAMKCRIASGMLIQRLHAGHDPKPRHHSHPSEAAFAGGETRSASLLYSANQHRNWPTDIHQSAVQLQATPWAARSAVFEDCVSGVVAGNAADRAASTGAAAADE